MLAQCFLWSKPECWQILLPILFPSGILLARTFIPHPQLTLEVCSNSPGLFSLTHSLLLPPCQTQPCSPCLSLSVVLTHPSLSHIFSLSLHLKVNVSGHCRQICPENWISQQVGGQRGTSAKLYTNLIQCVCVCVRGRDCSCSVCLSIDTVVLTCLYYICSIGYRFVYPSERVHLFCSCMCSQFCRSKLSWLLWDWHVLYFCTVLVTVYDVNVMFT